MVDDGGGFELKPEDFEGVRVFSRVFAELTDGGAEEKPVGALLGVAESCFELREGQAPLFSARVAGGQKSDGLFADSVHRSLALILGLEDGVFWESTGLYFLNCAGRASHIQGEE